MKRILLTGCNGQLGFELQRALAPLGEVVALDHAHGDLADPDALRALVRDISPQIIVNPAAYTAVDKAEGQSELAFAVNATAPGILGEEAARLGAWVLHFSTDYVFDGAQSAPYTETDTPNPQNVYGRSKRAGELALIASGASALILRTSWVFGAHGGNFARTILRLAGERESLDVVADQVGAPTSAALLADISAQLIAQSTHWAGNFPFGLYHVAAGGETTWYDYARHVVERARQAGKALKLRPEAIRAIASAHYPLPASRPANSRLDTQKFRQTFGLHLPDWRLGLDHVLAQLL